MYATCSAFRSKEWSYQGKAGAALWALEPRAGLACARNFDERRVEASRRGAYTNGADGIVGCRVAPHYMFTLSVSSRETGGVKHVMRTSDFQNSGLFGTRGVRGPPSSR